VTAEKKETAVACFRVLSSHSSKGK